MPCLRKKLYGAVLLVLSGAAQALPQGGEVVAGDANIAVTGDTMNIQQNSNRAILNFQSFDVAAQQTVNFHQPGSDAVALNRVLGNNLSEIHGAINANGQVYLINPNGVVFGSGAEINVGSLVVTTLDMTDQDFLAGRDAFSGTTDGRVENRGRIDADGRVVLLAPEVVNRGDITVPGGDITLRSGRQALLHSPGSEIPILLDDADFLGRVVNEGNLESANVALVLDGTRRSEAFDAAVNNTGLVRAVRANGDGGAIELLAPDSDLANSGVLNAGATGGSGGEVRVTGARIEQTGTINAAAAGTGNGGTVTLLAEDAIAMHSGSTISADAGDSGDGGDVVVIAERATWFTGDSTISARGGELAGDGGFVEVSGHEFVSVSGNVDVGATAGEGGLWYIDPTDITITNMDSNGTFVGGTWTLTGTPATSLINVVSLRNALFNGNDVTINTASGAASAGNITFSANTTLDYNGLGTLRTLTLQANGSIIFNTDSHISDSNPATAEGLNVVATAGTGFSLPNGATIYAGTGKIDITTLTGDATFTGLGSSANTADAIRVTASAGRLINGGAATWNLISNGVNGGVMLAGRDGIENITIDGTYVDAISSAGDVTLVGSDMLVVNRLSSANYASIYANAELILTNSTILGGNDFQLSSSSFVAVPQSGLTVPGTLTLLGPDIVDESFGRTLTLGANLLEINTNAAGGNLQINSTANTLSLTNGFTNAITVTDTNALTLAAIAPQAGAITINSGAGSDLTVGSNIELDNFTSSLTLNAGRNLLANANIRDSVGAVGNDTTLTLTAVNNVTFSSGSQVNAGAGNINVTATGGSVALGNLAGANLTITAGGAITDGNGAGLNLSGTAATLSAGTAIGALADSLESALNGITLSSGAGGAYLSNNRALNLTSATVNGDLDIALAAAGNLTLAQSAPSIAGNARFTLASGQLLVPSAGWSIGGNLTVNAEGIVDADTTVTVGAAAADLTLDGAAGILNTDFDTLVLQILGGQTLQVLDVDGLSLTSLDSNGDVTVTSGGTGNLQIGDIHLGGDGVTFDFNTGGALTYTGQLTSDAGANNVTFNFTSGAALNITGGLRDTASSAGAHHFNFSAGTDFTMGSAAWVEAWNGLIAIEALAGDATVTGLSTSNTAQNAVQVFALNGAILDANAARKDIDVPDGGFVLHAMGDIGDLQVESNFFDVVSATGDITFHEEASTSALRLETPGTASIYTGSQFSVDLAAPLVVNNLFVDAGGDFRVGDTGFAITGDLTVVANTVRDSNPNVTLAAANADITIRNGGTLARTWVTSFDQLALDITGTGSFSLTDADGLTLTSATTGGGATFTTTNADLILTSNPVVSGNLSLIATGSGDLIIPDTGLLHTGGLTVLADNLLDTDTSITLGAVNADITLRDGAQPASWTTSFTQLVLDIAGIGALDVTDTDALTIAAVSTGGDASFTATNGDLIVSAAPVVGGDLGLGTVGSGDVVIPDAGLILAGDLTVLADNLVDSDSDLILGAANADITLRDGALAQSWTTSFDQLALDISGAGDFSLADADGLTLTTVATGGNASFTTANADLVLTSAPVVAGDLALTTTGSGDLVIPDAGLVVGGDLTVLADDLTDSDSAVILGAANADITLRAGALARSWTTSFDQLMLNLTGAGDFSLTDTDGLALASATTGGNASFRTTGADLVLSSTPVVAGELSLATVGSGDVVIPDAGLVHTGDLTVLADNLMDSNSAVTLGAANADITLRDGALGQTWTTSFDQLVLNIAGTGDFAVTDSDGLTLISATTGGNASFNTTDADLTLAGTAAVGGNLTLSALGSGDVVVPDAGLMQAGDLTVAADNLRDSDTDLILSAANADISLRDGATAQNWTTSFDALVLSIAGAGALDVTDADGLTLTSATTGGSARYAATNADLVLTSAPVAAGSLELATIGSGDLVIPAGGLTHTGSLILTADNLNDGDTTLALEATDAAITLRDGALDQIWATAFDSLILAIAGTGTFAMTDADGLTLTTVSAGGNASFTATNADLTVATNPTVGGNLSLLTTGAGNVVLPATGLDQTGDLTIGANDLLDTDRSLNLRAANGVVTLRNPGGAHSFSTRFDTLGLDSAGTFAVSVTDADGLTLNAINTGGDASFAATDADLVLSGSPTVAGALNLSTLGSGDLIIADAGLGHAGALDLVADSLRDSDTAVSLTATALTATLRDQQVAGNWVTDITSLDLSLTGGGTLNLSNTGALTINGFTTDGLAALTSTGSMQASNIDATGDLALSSGADLSLANVNLGGGLQLTTGPAGTLTVPDAGLTVAGNLTVDAGRILNASGLASTSWVADQANFRLRDLQQATTLTTAAAVLNVTNDSAADLALQVADTTRIDTLASAGNVLVQSPGDLVLGDSSFAVAGELALTTAGNLQLDVAGLTVDNALRLNAATLNAAGGGALILAGQSADLTLTGAQALALTTRLSQLGVTYAAAGPFSLSNDRNLTLTRFSAPAAAAVTLAANGVLTLPDSGISAQQRLTIDAVDLLDSDRNLTLAAPQLAVRLSGASGTNAWALTADELDVLMRGSANLAVTDSDGLTLADLNDDAQAVLVENGNFNLSLASGDLILAADVNAADLTDDDSRAGIIDLAVAAGNLRSEGAVAVTSTNNLDQGASGYGIRMRLTDTSDANRNITFGSTTSLRAIGGDILIDTRPTGTQTAASRSFVQTLGSVVETYNNPGEPQNGVVLMNGQNVPAATGQLVRTGRTLAIVTDVQAQPPGNVLDEIDDLDETGKGVEQPEHSGPKAAVQFDRVFGTCDELDQKNQHRCRIDAALKAFLSHWLVGGEMPPKTEIR